MTPSTNTLYKVRYLYRFVESTTSKYNSFLLCVPKRSASTIIAVVAASLYSSTAIAIYWPLLLIKYKSRLSVVLVV